MRRNATGFTLIELLVVLGILILLSSLMLVKLDDVYDRSRSSTQAYSLADVGRQIEIFYGLNHKYPEGWDSLMNISASPATAPSPYTRYTKLGAECYAPSTLFNVDPTPLTDDMLSSLSKAGISHMFMHSSASGVVASDSATERHHFGHAGAGHDGTYNVDYAVTLNSLYESPGVRSEGLKVLLNDFALNPNVDDATIVDDATRPARIKNNIYIVLGFGKKATLNGNQVLEPPYLEQDGGTGKYSRALAVFEVPSVAGVTTRAKLVGIIGPDGRTRAMAQGDFLSGVSPH